MVPFSMTCNDPYRFQDHDILDVKQVYKPSVWRLCVLISHLFYVFSATRDDNYAYCSKCRRTKGLW